MLRGPQGALFGKNTAAGAVSVVSAGPTDQFEGKLTANYNFDFKGTDFSGYLSGPLTDTLSARRTTCRGSAGSSTSQAQASIIAASWPPAE